MKTKFYGVPSLTLVGIAIVLAVITIFQISLWLGIGYLLLCGVASFVVVYAYCAKCPVKDRCAHVLPGKAAMSFQRKLGPYSTTEILSMITALLLIMGPVLATSLIRLIFWNFRQKFRQPIHLFRPG